MSWSPLLSRSDRQRTRSTNFNRCASITTQSRSPASYSVRFFFFFFFDTRLLTILAINIQPLTAEQLCFRVCMVIQAAKLRQGSFTRWYFFFVHLHVQRCVNHQPSPRLFYHSSQSAVRSSQNLTCGCREKLQSHSAQASLLNINYISHQPLWQLQ